MTQHHVVCRTCDDLEGLAPTTSVANDAVEAHQLKHSDHVVVTTPVDGPERAVATDGGGRRD